MAAGLLTLSKFFFLVGVQDMRTCHCQSNHVHVTPSVNEPDSPLNPVTAR